MSTQEIVWWDYDELCERLSYQTVEDAFAGWYDEQVDVSDDKLPETVKLFGYARMEVRTPYSDWELESLVERMDEEYGDPDGAGTEITEEMRQETKAWAEKIAALYAKSCWACECVTQRVVNVREMLALTRGETT